MGALGASSIDVLSFFMQKVAEKESQMEACWALWIPFVPFGTSFGGPGEPNEVQKGAQERFYGYRKNVDFPYVFNVFWKAGLPHGPIGGKCLHALSHCVYQI